MIDRINKIANKHTLLALIQEIGQLYDEDIQFLRAYGRDVYEMNVDNLDEAIACFRELIRVSKLIGGKLQNEV